mgnify:CR=1 FL=1
MNLQQLQTVSVSQDTTSGPIRPIKFPITTVTRMDQKWGLVLPPTSRPRPIHLDMTKRKGGYGYSTPPRKIYQMASSVATVAKALKTLTTTAKKQGGNGEAVTNQKDGRVEYRRRRAPKKVRRKFRKIQQRATWAKLKAAPARTYVKNDRWSTSSNANEQNMTASSMLTLYGRAAALNAQGHRDLSDLNGADLTGSSSTYLFDTCSLDLTISAASDNASITELEIYSYIARKPYDDSTDPLNLLEQADGKNSAIQTTKLTVKNPGVSLFDIAQIGRYFLITKKERNYLGPGNSMFITERYNKNKVWKNSNLINIAENEQWAIPGLTRGFIIVFRGVPQFNSTTVDLPVTRLNFSAQRSYRYHIVNEGRTDATEWSDDE